MTSFRDTLYSGIFALRNAQLTAVLGKRQNLNPLLSPRCIMPYFNQRAQQNTKMAHMTNPLATPEQLYQRNSFGSLPQDLQDAVFFATQCLTQAAGLLLQLPQSVTAQANILIARYWLVDPAMSNEFSVSRYVPSQVHSALFLGRLLTMRRTSPLLPFTSSQRWALHRAHPAMYLMFSPTSSPLAPHSSATPLRITIRVPTTSASQPTKPSTPGYSTSKRASCTL